MHNGLSHFAGRGLPTIWSVMSSNQSEVGVAPVFPFTDRDAQVIKEWARSLDDWLVSSNSEHRAAAASPDTDDIRTNQHWLRRHPDSTTVQPPQTVRALDLPPCSWVRSLCSQRRIVRTT
jgi:hypothetical protein